MYVMVVFLAPLAQKIYILPLSHYLIIIIFTSNTLHTTYYAHTHTHTQKQAFWNQCVKQSWLSKKEFWLRKLIITKHAWHYSFPFYLTIWEIMLKIMLV